MRARSWPLLAVVPLMLPGDLPPVSRAPCAIAIELQVRAPLRWGAFEWHLVMGEAARIWAPYGVTLCWGESDDACRGLEVKLRVLLAEDPPPPPRAAQGSLLGWIWFRGSDPARGHRALAERRSRSRVTGTARRPPPRVVAGFGDRGPAARGGGPGAGPRDRALRAARPHACPTGADGEPFHAASGHLRPRGGVSSPRGGQAVGAPDLCAGRGVGRGGRPAGTRACARHPVTR